MAHPETSRQRTPKVTSISSPTPGEALKKHPGQLLTAIALAVVWIVFLAVMAAYNH